MKLKATICPDWTLDEYEEEFDCETDWTQLDEHEKSRILHDLGLEFLHEHVEVVVEPIGEE